MFKIVSKPRAWWPVTWPGVTEEGEIIENKIEMRFILLKVDEAVDAMREVREAQKKGEAAAEAGDAIKASEIYARVIKMIAEDWRGVARENGEALPWSDENLPMLMNVPGVFEAIQEAYRACIAGGRDIRAGN